DHWRSKVLPQGELGDPRRHPEPAASIGAPHRDPAPSRWYHRRLGAAAAAHGAVVESAWTGYDAVRPDRERAGRMRISSLREAKQSGAMRGDWIASLRWQ